MMVVINMFWQRSIQPSGLRDEVGTSAASFEAKSVHAFR
jgi:hypothetical protein